ncbi:MAG: hypothetical protein PUJ85_06405 [bacterium]|nr:hypothetical protein [bacterium]
MKKNIINQLQKAYVAIKNAESVNEVRLEPNSRLRNQLITIEELIKEILENKDEL